MCAVVVIVAKPTSNDVENLKKIIFKLQVLFSNFDDQKRFRCHLPSNVGEFHISLPCSCRAIGRNTEKRFRFRFDVTYPMQYNFVWNLPCSFSAISRNTNKKFTATRQVPYKTVLHWICELHIQWRIVSNWCNRIFKCVQGGPE